MSTRTLVLGGGFGGLATATELRRRLGPEHEIVVLDGKPGFFVGLRKLWVLVGDATLADGTAPRRRLEDRGIRFVQTEILSIDPGARRVETEHGTFEGDHVVVALGAEPRGDLVPGLIETEGAFNLYDPDAVTAASREVTTLEGGRIVVAIAGLPYKCPPAPYEAAMLLDDHLRRRGVRDATTLTLTTVQPGLLPNAGPAGARWVAEQLDRRGIGYRVAWKVARVERGRLVSEQEELPFDLALVVPPHKPPAVILGSGLTGGGEWVAVDRHTLRTAFEGVYAVGDVTHIPLEGGVALPKAGLFAEAQGERVAAAIAARVLGSPEPPAFDGRGACYMEMGGGEAALVRGDFFAAGGPAVSVEDPSPAHMEEKRRFEAGRLEKWLGA